MSAEANAVEIAASGDNTCTMTLVMASTSSSRDSPPIRWA
jgi:hypothetical protein